MNPAAVLIPLAAVAAGFIVFCLVDLARAEQVRHLPRWAWALLCLVTGALGGLIYLAVGRVRTAHEYQRANQAAVSAMSHAGEIIRSALGDEAAQDLLRWAGSQKAALGQAAQGLAHSLPVVGYCRPGHERAAAVPSRLMSVPYSC